MIVLHATAISKSTAAVPFAVALTLITMARSSSATRPIGTRRWATKGVIRDRATLRYLMFGPRGGRRHLLPRALLSA